MSFFLSCIFYLGPKIRKRHYREKLKAELLKPIYWLQTTVLDSDDWIIENNLCVVPEFLLDRFSWHVLPTPSKITVTCPKSVNWKNRVNSDLPKVSKMNIIFELLNISKMISLRIYISPVTEKLETSNLDSR